MGNRSSLVKIAFYENSEKLLVLKYENVKLSLWLTMEARRVVRRRGSHIF
jgi:hypothetical protein